MKQILFIESSHNRESTGSRHIASKLKAQIIAKYPEAKIVNRDLALSPPPHLTQAAVAGFFTPSESHSEESKRAVRISDELVTELKESDLLVLSLPMWNFGVPSSVKAWIDHVVRSGKTFAYSPEGVIKGLVPHLKVILVVSTGGVFSAPEMQSIDFAVPFLKQALSFIGALDIQVVRVEGTAVPPLKPHAIPNAERSLEALQF